MPDNNKVDGEDLAQFGYKQELTRSLGSFSSFAAGFSYLSVMSGMFQLFAFGFGLAGPMVWLSWIVVFAGMMMVALCFAESSAAFPIAGSVYSWATRQGSEAWGWMTGWIMLVASIASVAGVAVAWQISLPAISPVFQFVGDGTGKYDFAENAVVLGLILLVLITAANVAGIKVMAKANNLGVMAELLGVSLFIGLLVAHIHRGPGVVAHSMGLPAASSLGVGGAVLIAAIMPGWVMFGFDTAGSLAEETRDPRRRAPRAILNALGAGGGAGAILLLVALMAAPNLRDPKVASQGLPYIVQVLLGSGVGKGMLVFVVISTAAGALAIQTATIRFIFAMARDGKLPFITTGSVSGLLGEPGLAAYDASKGAVVNFTRQLAAEYAGAGIRVNCVCPGWIDTGFNDPAFEHEALDDEAVDAIMLATIPMKRQGTAEDVASAVAFLASDDASYISGHALVVDGGLTTRI
ncbi:SDR family oxidoreductase [Actinacidiphila soli]|uniref:SDR family oxidoreductase n=1 Tax=Actinacidiphila soli TaxID=2487275 RepID=UPI0013E2D8B0|nr:SDR family oxidoreductase [Actinacidiphila soli]